ncbi:MAG: PAS domain S-box protein, partial [Sulfurimonas sp.]|uniref:PAS domain-containing protein n=1 Tax=Sulfurimonas sp. TaxID=2022749 RepID=UPI0028CC60BB
MQKFQKNCATLFSDLLDNSNDMLFVFKLQDDKAEIVYVNKAAIEKSGYTLEEMNKIGIENFRKPTHESKEFKEHIEELKEKKSMLDYAILLTKDKREIPLEANVKIVQVDGSMYNIAVVRDITERVEYKQWLERELDEKTKLLKENNSVLNSYQDAIDASSILTRSDKSGIITYANDNFCKLSGYSKEEVLGKPHNIVRHEETPSEVFKDLWET